MKGIMACWLAVMMAITSGVTLAEIYRWVDEQGKVHFSDKPTMNNEAETVDEKALTARYSSYTQVKVQPNLIKNNKPSKLVMYTTSDCGYCAKARRYFAMRKIAYQEKNIERSKMYLKEFKKFGGKGVPVIFWGQYKMTGFNIARFEKMYEKPV